MFKFEIINKQHNMFKFENLILGQQRKIEISSFLAQPPFLSFSKPNSVINYTLHPPINILFFAADLTL